mmetsp:Transcript_80128/g.166734  ORF Transcript_80128/g.166734 Transcript_80128/m.166734 type:complete len:722 (-) Transcript_80128:101-2266(-)
MTAHESAAPTPAHPAEASPPTVGPNIQGNLEEYRLICQRQTALFGNVYEATGLSTGRSYAVKVFHISEVDRVLSGNAVNFCEVPLSEITFRKEMEGHAHIMQVEDYFKDEYCHYIIFLLAHGGDLLEELKLRPEGFSEAEAQFLIRQACIGLAELHNRLVAMQDVSLENMLISHLNDGEWQIKICDPGQARRFDLDAETGEECMVEFAGLVGKSFRPPELFKQEPYHATKVDAWCVGWSTFYLLAAQPLFLSAQDQDPDWKLFAAGDFNTLFRSKSVRISAKCGDFITKLMHLDPSKRMSVKEALQHEWLNSGQERVLYARQAPQATPRQAPMQQVVTPNIIQIGNPVPIRPRPSLAANSGFSTLVGGESPANKIVNGVGGKTSPGLVPIPVPADPRRPSPGPQAGRPNLSTNAQYVSGAVTTRGRPSVVGLTWTNMTKEASHASPSPDGRVMQVRSTSPVPLLNCMSSPRLLQQDRSMAQRLSHGGMTEGSSRGISFASVAHAATTADGRTVRLSAGTNGRPSLPRAVSPTQVVYRVQSPQRHSSPTPAPVQGGIGQVPTFSGPPVMGAIHSRRMHPSPPRGRVYAQTRSVSPQGIPTQGVVTVVPPGAKVIQQHQQHYQQHPQQPQGDISRGRSPSRAVSPNQRIVHTAYSPITTVTAYPRTASPGIQLKGVRPVLAWNAPTLASPLHSQSPSPVVIRGNLATVSPTQSTTSLPKWTAA